MLVALKSKRRKTIRNRTLYRMNRYIFVIDVVPILTFKHDNWTSDLGFVNYVLFRGCASEAQTCVCLNYFD